MDIHTIAPEPGKDYPQNWNEFLDWFPTEDSCRQYLELLRWPDGFTCPNCNHNAEPSRASRGRLLCTQCHFQASVTSGTIFSKTRTPLRIWLGAAWYLTNQKQGVSALGLQRVLGLSSYQTAWTILHRFRRAMIRPNRSQLSGLVEVDESFLDIREKSSVPRNKKKSTTNRVLVGIAVEILEPNGFGRIRLQKLESDSQESVTQFIQNAIKPGSHVRTDGSAAYLKIEGLGYIHDKKIQLGSEIPAHKSLPGVHRIASLVKRWLLGTHHGGVKSEHLSSYLDEFVFRFNRRKSRHRGMLFYRLLQQAVQTEQVAYSEIIQNPKQQE